MLLRIKYAERMCFLRLSLNRSISDLACKQCQLASQKQAALQNIASRPRLSEMSTPVTKKRRIELAANALLRPFKSPLKPQSAVENSTHDAPQPLCTSPPQRPSVNLITAPSLSVRLDRRQQYAGSSLRPITVPHTDSEVATIVRVQRQLENKLRELKEELNTTQQAKKIETDSLNHGSCGAEIDGELIALAQRWKTASRQAAEELFGGVKDRVNRYAAQVEYCVLPGTCLILQIRY